MALPTLQTELQIDIAGLQWVVNAYALCLSAFMLSIGTMADRQGHRRAWLTSAGGLYHCIGSVRPSIILSMLVIGRAIEGISASLLISGAMPILTHAFPKPENRPMLLATSPLFRPWRLFSARFLVVFWLHQWAGKVFS